VAVFGSGYQEIYQCQNICDLYSWVLPVRKNPERDGLPIREHTYIGIEPPSRKKIDYSNGLSPVKKCQTSISTRI
jgi:hypothetical protein